MTLPDPDPGKQCGTCGEVKPLAEFYRSRVQVLPDCKSCHNARCVRRVQSSRERKRQQYLAKRNWTLAHPEAKRRHEGRQIFGPAAPAILSQLESAIHQLAIP